MKRFVVLVVIFCVIMSTARVEAQGISKITGGTIFVASGTTDFSSSEKPFNFGQNLLLNICFITNKTYHNIVYGTANNSIKIVNGIPFGVNGMDVYFIPGYNLTSKVCSFASGVEKMIKAGDVNFFLFSEIGREIKSGSKTTLCIGFHVNIQTLIYRRKS